MIRFLALVLAALLLALPAAADVLPAPTGLRVEPAPPPGGTDTLNLRWDPVPGAFGYEVYQFRGGRWWLDEENASRTPITASTTISGLEPGSPYEFKVRALGPDGPSEMSEAAGGRTLVPGAAESPPTPPAQARPKEGGSRVEAPAPEPPRGVIGVFSDSDRVQLSWRAVDGAAYYRIEEQVDGKWVEVEGEAGRPRDNRTVLLDHPRPGPFRFRISAVGTNGRMSEPSFAVTVDRD